MFHWPRRPMSVSIVLPVTPLIFTYLLKHFHYTYVLFLPRCSIVLVGLCWISSFHPHPIILNHLFKHFSLNPRYYSFAVFFSTSHFIVFPVGLLLYFFYFNISINPRYCFLSLCPIVLIGLCPFLLYQPSPFNFYLLT